MVKSWQKKLDNLDNDLSRKLYAVVVDIIRLKLDWYDIKKLEWFDNLFRLRKWKIRIVFSKTDNKWIIEKIDFRWDIYKWL